MLTETIYDAWGVAHILPGLYDEFPIFYRLTHYSAGGALIDQLIIRQPVGFDKLRLILSRSSDWHGVNYEYSDPKTVCELDGYSGRDYVESIFRSEGEDATVTLQTGIKNGGTYIVEYEGRLNFSTYKRTKRRISIGLERKSLQTKLLARWDTPFSLNPSLQIPLSPQALNERFECVVKAGKRVEQTFPGDTNSHLWLQFDTSEPTTAEIEEFATGKPMGLSDADGPVAADSWLFKFRSAGIRKVTIDLNYRLWWAVKKRTISIGAAKVTNYSLKTLLLLVRKDGTKQEYPITTLLTAKPNSGEVTAFATGKLETTIDTAAGDRLYLYGLLNFSHNKNELQQTQVQLTMITQRISVSGLSKNIATSAAGSTLFEAIDAGIQQATDYYNRLRSAYYGLAGPVYPVSGPGAERIVMNGFGIRRFEGDHPVKISLRDLMASLQAIDGIGLAYGSETDLVGQRDTVEVRPVADFYRPVELLRLDSVENYKEEVIESELYSNVDVGYAKWVDQGTAALEEVHTTHQLVTPIRNERAKMTLISKLLTSSLAIERTRREQFADTPKDGTAYDDEVFLIQCKPTPSYVGPMTLTLTPFTRIGVIQTGRFIPWITPGMIVVLGGTAVNDYPYTVTSVRDASAIPWGFTVAKNDVFRSEVVQRGQISPSQLSPLTPETGADLINTTGIAVAGLTAAETAYNLRLTPGRMLFATAPLWAGCLVDKQAGEVVRKAKIPQNNGLMTVIEGATPLRVKESQPVAVDELLPRLLWRPREQSYSVRITRQQMQRLRLGLTGKLPIEVDDNGQSIDRNYGYVSCLDETGVRVAGYVMEAVWSPQDEKVVFKLRQTALDLNDTTSGLDCTQFAGWTIDQAEQADAKLRRRIELCRFIDVDIL